MTAPTLPMATQSPTLGQLTPLNTDNLPLAGPETLVAVHVTPLKASAAAAVLTPTPTEPTARQRDAEGQETP